MSSRPRARRVRRISWPKLADLRDRGVITAGEFDREKAKILT
jgi:putative oligomerization/nucleic acid binding protein